MYEWLEFLRIFLSLSFLVLSSFHDLRTREVPNRVWILFGPSGFALSLLQFSLTKDNSFLVFWLLSFLATTGLSLALFYLGLFGGADAKALICLALALPVYPSSLDPHLDVLMPLFPLSVFSNAVLGSSLLVFAIVGYNLFRLIQTRGKLFEGLEREPFWNKILAFFTGYEVDLDKLRRGSHYISLEYFSRGEHGEPVRHLRVSPRLDEETTTKNYCLDDSFEGIKGKVWATPGLPFLVFVTTGFFISLLIGDVITWLTIEVISSKSI